MTGRTCLLAIAITTSAGCGTGAPATADGGVAVWGDSLVLVEELRIGNLVGDEAYTFGNVAALAPAPDGSLYVADNQVPIIRRYDRDGRYIGDIGRRGEGPGEYRWIVGIAVLSDGRLTAWEGPGGLSIFDPTGSFIESHSVPNGRVASRPGDRAFVYGAQGGIFVRVALEGALPGSQEFFESEWASVAPDGQVERLPADPPADREGAFYGMVGRGGPYQPFTRETLSTVGPDGSRYWVRNDEYVIHRVLPSGEEVEITREQVPVRVGAQERAEWEDNAEQMAGLGMDVSTFLPIPEVKPLIREILVDPEGRLWVSRYTEAAFMEYSPEERASLQERLIPSYQWRDTLTWDVFDDDGELLGVVTFPFKTWFGVALGDQVWGVQAGDHDEDYVVRWRIVPAQQTGE